jgi:hypothetical protein
MKKFASVYRSTLVVLSCSVFAMAQSGGAPQPSTFTTLVTTPRSIEGLTGDNIGNLYLAAVRRGPMSHMASQSWKPLARSCWKHPGVSHCPVQCSRPGL